MVSTLESSVYTAEVYSCLLSPSCVNGIGNRGSFANSRFGASGLFFSPSSEQPFATINPPSVTYQIGNNVSIKCQVNGFPFPSLMWYKDGLQLESGERISANKDGVLLIRHAQLLDAGEYECTVWNIAGQGQATVTLLYTGN